MRFLEIVGATALLSTLGAAAPVSNEAVAQRTEFAPWYRGLSFMTDRFDWLTRTSYSDSSRWR